MTLSFANIGKDSSTVRIGEHSVLKALDSICVEYSVIARKPLRVYMTEPQFTMFLLQWTQDKPYKHYTVIH